MNGLETEIVMKPLSFMDFGDDADVKERTQSTEVEEKETNENNVEEQATK